jgi:hypothetical protein
MSQYFPNVCRQAHCTTCRASVSGIKWRSEIAAVFRVPDDNINWTCPHGYAWDETTPTPMAVAPQVIEHIGAVAMSLQQIRQAIDDLGRPEWLVLKLTEAEAIIGDERNCTACVMTARCRALQQNISDWKRLAAIDETGNG